MKFLEPCDPINRRWFENYFRSLGNAELRSIYQTLVQEKHMSPVLLLLSEKELRSWLDLRFQKEYGSALQNILGTPSPLPDTRNCVLEILLLEAGRRRIENQLFTTSAPTASKRLTLRSRIRAIATRTASTAWRLARKLRATALSVLRRKSRT